MRTTVLRNGNTFTVTACDECGRVVSDNDECCEICRSDYCKVCYAKGRLLRVGNEDVWVCEHCSTFAYEPADAIARIHDCCDAILSILMKEWRETGQTKRLERETERMAKG